MTQAVKCCGYLKNLFNLEMRNKIIDFVIDSLKDRTDEFDAIAISGYSMAIVGSIVAHQFKKEIIVVRKQDERCHSSEIFEGRTSQRCVIIDDLIASGKSLSYVNQHLSVHDCITAGVVLYHDRTPPLGEIECLIGPDKMWAYDKFY